MTFGIAIGTNLGDREANLQRGLAMLIERAQPAVILAGGVYETEPVIAPRARRRF